MSVRRTTVAALVLSAAGLVSIIADEGYTERAVVPTKNDRPTVGFGSTFRDDGSPVQMGDTITPAQAVKRTVRSEEHTSELQSLMRISYAVFCLKKKKKN